jgi:putative transposase
MGPYSIDFRLKVIRAYERGEGSQRQLARVFGVSLSFVQALLQRYRRTGSVAPKPHGGGNPGKMRGQWATVERLHHHQPDASLAERCEQLAVEGGVVVSRTTMSRALRQLRLTRKKRLFEPRNKRLRKGAKPGRLIGRRSARSQLKP